MCCILMNLNSICDDQMEDLVLEDLETKNLIQDILRQQLHTAEETLWCEDVFRDMELVPITVLQIQYLPP